MATLPDNFDELAEEMSVSERLRFSDAHKEACFNGANIWEAEERCDELSDLTKAMTKRARATFTTCFVIFIVLSALNFFEVREISMVEKWLASLTPGLLGVRDEIFAFHAYLEGQRLRLQIQSLRRRPHITRDVLCEVSDREKVRDARVVSSLFFGAMDRNVPAPKSFEFSYLEPELPLVASQKANT